MVRKTNTKYKGKKKYQKKKPIVYKSMPTGFPPIYYNKVKYSNYQQFPGSNDSESLAFTLNNVRRPDDALASIPAYVKTLFGSGTTADRIYNACTVYAVKIDIRFTNESTSCCKMAVLATNDPSASGLIPVDAARRPWSSKLIQVASEGSGASSVAFKRYYPLHKVMGVKKSTYMSSVDYGMEADQTGPYKDVNLFIYLQSGGFSGQKVTGEIDYDLTLYCKWWDMQIEDYAS